MIVWVIWSFVGLSEIRIPAVLLQLGLFLELKTFVNHASFKIYTVFVVLHPHELRPVSLLVDLADLNFFRLEVVIGPKLHEGIVFFEANYAFLVLV